jgi:hypothetical protein
MDADIFNTFKINENPPGNRKYAAPEKQPDGTEQKETRTAVAVDPG